LAEELSDETIDRVINKIEISSQVYVGNPIYYFYGVAKKVFLESTKKPVTVELPAVLSLEKDSTDLSEEKDQRLTKCLKKLCPEEANLIIEYYKKDKSEKIKHRKLMAEELGLSMEALRVKAFRVRTKLQNYYFEETKHFSIR
jgi:DNA-directed RNA polymerase specialized sigma24 family protein